MAFGSLRPGCLRQQQARRFFGAGRFARKPVLPDSISRRSRLARKISFSPGGVASKHFFGGFPGLQNSAEFPPISGRFLFGCKGARAVCAACPVCQPGLSPSLAREGPRVCAWQVGFPACAFCQHLCHNYFQARLYLSRLASRLSKLSAPGRFPGW